VLYNKTQSSKTLIEKYAKAGEAGVAVDEMSLTAAHYTALGAELVAGKAANAADASDAVAHLRSSVHHDSDKIAREIMKLYVT
jgi:predicted negative regulator of RcsB-dependent stress response